MGKRGGPCQAPGKEEGSICGITEISDRCDWRKGGKFKPEHKGKACCTKNACRVFLGVIADPKIARAEAASASPASALARSSARNTLPRAKPLSTSNACNVPQKGEVGDGLLMQYARAPIAQWLGAALLGRVLGGGGSNFSLFWL